MFKSKNTSPYNCAKRNYHIICYMNHFIMHCFEYCNNSFICHFQYFQCFSIQLYNNALSYKIIFCFYIKIEIYVPMNFKVCGLFLILFSGAIAGNCRVSQTNHLSQCIQSPTIRFSFLSSTSSNYTNALFIYITYPIIHQLTAFCQTSSFEFNQRLSFHRHDCECHCTSVTHAHVQFLNIN